MCGTARGASRLRLRAVSRLSQAIAEGDGISILVEVGDAAGASAAEREGADGLGVRRDADAIRSSSQLPLLHLGGTGEASVRRRTQWSLSGSTALGAGPGARPRCVVRVSDSDDLERVLAELDPEIFLLAARAGRGRRPAGTLLALLHDVPAGKLAIADLHDATADDVAELERAGRRRRPRRRRQRRGARGVEPPDV